MHIYGDLLHRYVKRELPEGQLAELDGHVSNCLLCAHVLADEAADTTGWERRGLFGRLVRIEPPVLPAEPVENQEARAA
jgi:hypothetical protein